jgi:hypothetical protein
MAGNKRSIPELRSRIREIAEEHGIHELRDIADEMYRQPPVSKAAPKSKALTPRLAAEIRVFARKNPGLHQRDIAAHFDVNPGRVSEALNGRV